MRRALLARRLLAAALIACAAPKVAPAQSFEPDLHAEGHSARFEWNGRHDVPELPIQPAAWTAAISPLPPVGEPAGPSPADVEGAAGRPAAAGKPITPRSASGPSPARMSGGSLWTTVWALAAVVGLIYALSRWWRRHAPSPPRSLPSDAFEVLGRRRLDPRRSIELYRIGGRILVVALSPDGLRTLSEIDDPVEVDRIAGLCRRTESHDAFAGKLRLMLGGAGDGHAAPHDDEDAAAAGFTGAVPLAAFAAHGREHREAGHA